MARLDRMSEPMRTHLRGLDCPRFENRPWSSGPPLSERRVSLISTAGLHLRDDRPFSPMSGEYRLIPAETEANELVMSHISTNFDRAGFQEDWNVVFPLERLNELAGQGIFDSVADFHYSFMGATPPEAMESTARHLADLLRKDEVNAALLVPV